MLQPVLCKNKKGTMWQAQTLHVPMWPLPGNWADASTVTNRKVLTSSRLQSTQGQHRYQVWP